MAGFHNNNQRQGRRPPKFSLFQMLQCLLLYVLFVSLVLHWGLDHHSQAALSKMMIGAWTVHHDNDNDHKTYLDPTDPKRAARRHLGQFITVGGVLFRPGMHYNCTTTTKGNQTITLPRLPTFLIIGTQKGGTSALTALLSKHQRILKPAYFEPHFFDQHPAVTRRVAQIHALTGQEQLEWNDKEYENDTMANIPNYQTPPLICDVRQVYASTCFFKGQIMQYPAMLTYEKTPAYILVEGAAQTIQTIAPWAKIIVSLRNPVDRAFSHYKMAVAQGKVQQSFEQLVARDLHVLRAHNFSVPDGKPFATVTDNENETTNNNNNKTRWKFSNFLYRSLYADQLRPWLERYTLGDNLLVVQYERLNDHPDVVLREILEFLQIPDHSYRYQEMVQSYSPVHWKTETNARQLTLQNKTREYLQRLFEPYNEQLVPMLGDEWKDVWKGKSRY